MSDPTNMPTPSEPIDRPLARACLARLIAELFTDQDAADYERLGDDAVEPEARHAADRLGLDPDRVTRLFCDRPSFETYLEARSQLLGHTARSNCPPHELEYCHSEVFQQSQRLADIAGFYRAFGLEPAGAMSERPDHIIAEWEFLFVLAAKECHAIETGEADGAARCRDAQRLFLSEHASYWMPAFFERLRRADDSGFFGRAALLALDVLREWCETCGVTTGASWLELRTISDEDSNIECGADSGGGTVELGPRLAAAMGM